MLTTQSYRFAPSRFEGILGLSEDLDNFYQSLEKRNSHCSSFCEIELQLNAENLFFTLKARNVEGLITPALFYELRDYIGELTND